MENKCKPRLSAYEVRMQEEARKKRRLLRALRNGNVEEIRNNISTDPNIEYNIRISPLSLARLLGLTDIAKKVQDNGGEELLKRSEEEEVWAIRATLLGVPESDSEPDEPDE